MVIYLKFNFINTGDCQHYASLTALYGFVCLLLLFFAWKINTTNDDDNRLTLDSQSLIIFYLSMLTGQAETLHIIL